MCRHSTFLLWKFVFCFLVVVLLPICAYPQLSFELIFTERGSDTSDYAGHRIAGVGDINGDGFDDVAICFKGRDSTFIYFGNNVKDSIPDQKIYGGFNVVYGHDVTGDGIGDVITSNGKYCFIYKGFGDSLGTQAMDTIYPDFRYHIIDTSFGVEIATGMVDGDSIFDIAILTDFTDSTSRLRLVYGGPEIDSATFDWGYDYPSYSHTMRALAVLDFDGDDQNDIIIGNSGHLDSLGKVEIFWGEALNKSPDLSFGPPPAITDPTPRRYFGFTVNSLGDINADGHTDFGVTCRDYQGLVYFSGPSADTLVDIITSLGSTIIKCIGDINRDGFYDFATGNSSYHLGDGRVTIFLGGPRADSIPETWITVWDLPVDLIQSLGYQVEPAGDFNGDGLDDIMFSAETWSDSWQKGRVYIVAGDTDIVTDVFSNNDIVPSGFWIKNHPNPFNIHTTITLFVPYKATATIRIYNILGRHLRTLYNDILKAGIHNISWDGKDDAGDQVSTGVYLMKYVVGRFSGEVKLILLK